MVSYVWRSLERVAVLVPGIIIAYFSVRDIFPYFDRRLPLGIAIVITYALAAYVLIPAFIRTWRLLVPAKHLPVYCITPDGFASDPLNIGLIGSRQQLIDAMTAAGWHMAEPYTLRNATYEVISIILKKPYHGEPMTALYLFGRKQDIGFEIQLIEHGRGHRHHVRFWATTFDDINDLSPKTIRWRERKQEAVGSNLLWLGAASRDAGIALVKHSIQLSHMIQEDTNLERTFVADSLTQHSLAQPLTTVTLSQPYRLSNRSWLLRSGYLRTDGQMPILRLKG
jgi:hypothetical protein